MIVQYSTKYVPTLRLFAENNSFIRVVVGPIGSGKSVGSGPIEILSRSAAQDPGPDGVRRTRWAVVRNTYPELRDTTQKTFFDWIKPRIHGEYKVAEKTFFLKFQADDGSLVESEILFKALDDQNDVRDLLSLELTGIWFNELREIAKSIFDMAQGRIGRYPRMVVGGPTWWGVWGDTNAPDTDHWLYKMLETDSLIYPADHARAGKVRVSKFHQASGLDVHPDGIYGVPIPGIHAENLPNLVPGYYADLAVGKDQDWIKVYIEGKYGYVKDGRPVYGNWNNPTHVSPFPIEIVNAYPLVLAWDFGYDFAACVMGQQLPNGRVNIKHERVVEGMGARRFARDIIKPFIVANYIGVAPRILGTGDLYGKNKMPTDESTCFQELIDAGLPAKPAETNAWQPRFSSVDTLLTKQISVEGKMVPAFQVDPECKTLIKGFDGEYQYKRILDLRHERYADKPVKNIYSHPHDALQYLCMFLEKGLQSERQVYGPTQKPMPTGAWT